MQTYRVFLFTCWQEDTAETNSKTWRYRLEEPRTGEQHGFTDLEQVMAFLQESLQEIDEDEGNGRSQNI
jgi:hypothetical protein